MIEDIKAALGIAMFIVAMGAVGTASYIVGVEVGMRRVAKRIPEIRRLEKLNALAPRSKSDD